MQGFQAGLKQVDERIEPVNDLQKLNKNNICRVFLPDMYQFMLNNGIGTAYFCADKEEVEKGKCGVGIINIDQFIGAINLRICNPCQPK